MNNISISLYIITFYKSSITLLQYYQLTFGKLLPKPPGYLGLHWTISTGKPHVSNVDFLTFQLSILSFLFFFGVEQKVLLQSTSVTVRLALFGYLVLRLPPRLLMSRHLWNPLINSLQFCAFFIFPSGLCQGLRILESFLCSLSYIVMV